MLIKYIFLIYVYTLSFFDYLLSFVPNMDYISTALQKITTAIMSICNFFHLLLPNSFSLFALYVNLAFGVWLAFYFIRRIIYGLILGWLIKQI